MALGRVVPERRAIAASSAREGETNERTNERIMGDTRHRRQTAVGRKQGTVRPGSWCALKVLRNSF